MLIVLNTIHNGNGSNSSVSFLDPFLTYLELLRNKHFTSSCYWNIVSIPRHFNDICVFNFLTSGEKVFQGRPCFWWQQSNCSILHYFAGMLDWVALLLRINQNNSLKWGPWWLRSWQSCRFRHQRSGVRIPKSNSLKCILLDFGRRQDLWPISKI